MSTTAPPVTTDRSDFRTVVTGGTTLGLLTAAGVALYLLVARSVPGNAARGGVELVIVIATGLAAAFLPGRWCEARSVEGIAGAAALGLWGTIVFSVIDIALLRPVRAYPWTWDAVGGGTTWWYLPIWWMLGTFLAWMGGIRTAAGAARGHTGLAGLTGPVVAGALVAAALAKLGGLAVLPPVAAGAGFALTLAALALLALARQA